MNWPLVSLEDVCSKISDGTHQAPNWATSGVPFLFVSNIRNGSISFDTNKFVSTDEYRRLTKRSPVEAGDVLYTAVGSYGNSAVVPCGKTFVFQRHIAHIKPNRNLLDAAYLSRVLETPSLRLQADREARGVAQKTVTLSSLRKFQIHLPPLSEQRRITAILDKADALRRKRRHAVELLGDLTKSIFWEMFDKKQLERIAFKDAVYFQEGPGVRNWQFRAEGVKLINVKNIVEGNLDVTNTSRYLDPKEVDAKYSHFLLSAGDLVMASSGVTWGKIAQVYDRHLPICLNTSMIRLRPLDGFVKAYVRAFIEYGDFRKQIGKLITGSAQPNFGPSHLAKVTIPAAGAKAQIEFEKRTEKIETLRDAARSQQERLDLLFSSLQHRAFSGQL